MLNLAYTRGSNDLKTDIFDKTDDRQCFSVADPRNDYSVSFDKQTKVSQLDVLSKSF